MVLVWTILHQQALHILTIFRSEGDVVVKELAELHHHVGVAGVRVVLVRVILLRHPPRIVEGADPLTTSRLLSTILEVVFK